MFADFVKYLLRSEGNKIEQPRREISSPTKSEVQQEEKTGLDYDIDKFFKTFAENKGGLTNNTLKISVKAFMYNYKVRFTKRKESNLN